jgi:hypothetical protein
MFTVTVPTEQLAAALLFAAKKDIRYNLNGVFIDAKAQNIVAADGPTMYVGAPNTLRDIEGALADVIVPRDFVEAIVKWKLPSVIISCEDDGRRLTAKGVDTQITALSVDGTFPDWRRVYPKSEDVSGVAAYLNPEYLMRAWKANIALGGSKKFPTFAQKQGGVSGCSMVTFFENKGHAMIMPMRAAASSYVRFSI